MVKGITLFIMLAFALILLNCQGKLSDEQRAKLKEGQEAHTIKKIDEGQIIAAAFDYGRTIAHELEIDSARTTVDDLETKYQVVIKPLQAGDSVLLEMEQQIIEAYTSGSSDQLADNIQKIGTDSLLYTKPMLSTRADGSTSFNYALGIRMPRKAVILSMDN